MMKSWYPNADVLDLGHYTGHEKLASYYLTACDSETRDLSSYGSRGRVCLGIELWE
jgi:hypothetical protein